MVPTEDHTLGQSKNLTVMKGRPEQHKKSTVRLSADAKGLMDRLPAY